MIHDIELDHVAVAVERQGDVWPRYAGDLPGSWIGGGGAPGFYSAQVEYANGMKVEVLEPYQPEQNDFLRRFLDRNGPGPHHLTYKVPNLRAALAEVEAAGYRPVGVNLSSPHWKEAFLHPKDAPGVVVQLAQSSGGGDWGGEPTPDWFPEPRTEGLATLLRVTHAVADLDDGLALFAGLLGGESAGEGESGGVRWTDLAWPGAGRVRLVADAGRRSELDAWLGDRRGRIHDLAFVTDRPSEISGAAPVSSAVYEVAPGDNFGTRLVLAESADPFRGSALGYVPSATDSAEEVSSHG